MQEARFMTSVYKSRWEENYKHNDAKGLELGGVHSTVLIDKNMTPIGSNLRWQLTSGADYIAASGNANLIGTIHGNGPLATPFDGKLLLALQAFDGAGTTLFFDGHNWDGREVTPPYTFDFSVPLNGCLRVWVRLEFEFNDESANIEFAFSANANP